MSMAPGWYPDPFSSGYVRWWDGKAWSSATQVAQRADAPPESAAGPAAPPGQPAAPAPQYGAPYSAPQPPTPYGAPPQPQQPPWSGYQPYPPGPPRPTFPLASWGTRFAARLIDWAVLALVLVPLYIVILWPAITEFVDRLPRDPSVAIDPDVVATFQTRVISQALLLGVIAAVLQLAYEIPQLAAYSRTLGMRVLGIRVRPLVEDRPMTWADSSIRTGVMVGGFVLAGGLWTLVDDLWPLWDKPWQQALHDKAAKTVVVPR